MCSQAAEITQEFKPATLKKAMSNENFSAGWMQLVTLLESSQHNEWIEAGTKCCDSFSFHI